MNIGTKIKEYRELKKLTITALADKIGTSRPYLSDIERGKKNPSFIMIDKIAKALDISANDLLSSGEKSELSSELKRLLYNAKQLRPELLSSINAMIEAIINNK